MKDTITSTEKNILTDLSHLGLLCISGIDAKKFLQGQLTCDLTTVTSTQSQLGAHCNPQGRILSLFRIFLFQENYYLQMPLDNIAIALTALQKYAVFFKVTLKEASQTLQQISYTGLEAEKNLAAIFPHLPTTTGAALEFNNMIMLKIPSIQPHYVIIATKTDIAALKMQLADGVQIGNENLWKLSQINAGIPSIYAVTSGKFLPHEINLQLINGINFEKGCYTGQEIIARMHYRGQLKKHLYHAYASTQNVPIQGADIFSAQACGSIVDSCLDRENICHFLAIINDDTVEAQELFLDPDKTEPVKFLSLPYDLGIRSTYV